MSLEVYSGPYYSNKQVTYTKAIDFTKHHIEIDYTEQDDGSALNLSKNLDSLTSFIPLVDGLNLLDRSLRISTPNGYLVNQSGNLVNQDNQVAGSIDLSTGRLDITEWQANVTFDPKVESAILQAGTPPISNIVFRTTVSPLQPSSLKLFIELQDGTAVTISTDEQGNLSGHPFVHGIADFRNGVMVMDLYEVVAVNDNPEVKNEWWYTVDQEYTRESDSKKVVNRPHFMKADKIRYDAVAYTYLPLDSDLIGLDTVRLPSDGRVRFVSPGDVGVITEKKQIETTLTAIGNIFDIGQVRLTSVNLIDANGKSVDESMFTVDLDGGKVSLNNDYVANDYQTPLTADYRMMDMGLVVETDISGSVTMSTPMTRDYSTDAVFSTAFITGNQQARAYGVFSQKSWTEEWSDGVIGDDAVAQYQIATNPIIVTNRSCIEERWAIVFTSSTGFRVIGETVGQIGVGVIGSPVEISNPVTNTPYFIINTAGWGQGWQPGNVLRFNTKAAKPPVWLGMAIQQHVASAQDTYEFGIEMHGNVDREAS